MSFTYKGLQGDDLLAYIMDKLELYEATFDLREIKDWDSAPTSPFEGQVILVTGGWNPGDGDGTYIYRNGAWEPLENGLL